MLVQALLPPGFPGRQYTRPAFVAAADGLLSILEPCEWEVETDRGRTTFVLKAEEDVRRLGPNQALILDSTGIRYLIADLNHLDAYSTTTLERYV